MPTMPIHRPSVLAATAVATALAGVARAQDAGAPPTDLEEAIVVVAKRSPTPEDRVTAAVTTLTERDVERRQATHVDDLLREVPGVQVVRDGPTGQFSRVFLRGAASNQTLVLVDGVPQNDATTGGGFDLGDLGAEAVERIEVLRGSYGVLYGSEAIGGVVSVTTRRGRREPSGFVRVEGGSFDTHREVVGVSGADETVDFALTAADHRTHGERDREDFRSGTVTSRVGVALDDTLRLDWSGRYADSTVESPFDFATSGVLPVDRNIERDRKTFSSGLGATWDPCAALSVRGHVSWLDVRSEFRNGPDGVDVVDPDFTPGSGDEVRVVRDELRSRNDERDLRWRLDGTWRVGDSFGWTRPTDGGVGLDLTAGAEWLRQDSDARSTFPDFGAPTSSTQRIDDTTRTTSLFVQGDVLLPDLGPFAHGVVTLGVRDDDHSEAGSETSPYLGARVAVAATDTTLRASRGEGFRAPKPSELLDPFVGNPDLGPETSTSRDVGVEQRLLDGTLVLGLTWFELDVDDLIAYDAGFVSPAHPFGALRNFGRTRTTGTEWSAGWDVGSGVTLRGAYTRQHPEDRETGADLPNRVRWFGSLGASWEDGPWLVSVDGAFSGALHGPGGTFTYPEPAERRSPGRVVLVDVTARWQATEDLALFARIENLLDDDWVATPSSPAGPPLAVYLGAQWDF